MSIYMISEQAMLGCKKVSFGESSVQGGPPAVISTVITPLIGVRMVRTPVTHS